MMNVWMSLTTTKKESHGKNGKKICFQKIEREIQPTYLFYHEIHKKSCVFFTQHHTSSFRTQLPLCLYETIRFF